MLALASLSCDFLNAAIAASPAHAGQVPPLACRYEYEYEIDLTTRGFSSKKGIRQMVGEIEGGAWGCGQMGGEIW